MSQRSKQQSPSRPPTGPQSCENNGGHYILALSAATASACYCQRCDRPVGGTVSGVTVVQSLASVPA